MRTTFRLPLALFAGVTLVSTAVQTIYLVRSRIWIHDDPIADVGHYITAGEAFLHALVPGAILAFVITYCVWGILLLVDKIKKGKQ